MFSFLKKKEEPAQAGIPAGLLSIRETLYTNASLDPFLARLQPDVTAEYPWRSFAEANEALKSGDKNLAIAKLKEITAAQQGIGTRIRLQAWHTLASLGEQPVESLRGYTQGVILENHTAKGLDIVAAYSDYSARYFNPSGTGVVWDAREKEIDQLILNLLSVGFEIAKRIGVGLHDMPAIPPQGYVRIFIMAYDGSTVGQGPYEQLYKDPMGKVAIDTGLKLMHALMKKHKDKNSVAHFV